MAILADIKMYGRYIWGLRGFLKHTLTLEEAKAIIKKRMEERETNFLRLVRKGIFGYPKSPYLPLMRLAKCEMGDIENMVKNKGLENTLRSLKEAGVYVTFEEFKGREPIVRGGKVIPVEARNFDNPYLSRYYEATTSGTTGAGTRVASDLDHLAAVTPNIMLSSDAHGILYLPTCLWFGTLPDSTGIDNLLRGILSNNIPCEWFSPITKKNFKPTLKNQIATYYTILMGRFLGLPIPWPKPVTLDQANQVAHWAKNTLMTHGPCLVRTHVSMAVRVCLSAQEEGIDLTGVTFIIGGEPPTPAKVQEITRTGARFAPHYFFIEAGIVGFGCASPADCNDLHFFKDRLALIQCPIQVPGFDIKVNAFCYTSLLPTTPKIILNVENDDYGDIETRSCGCPMEEYGFTEHLRHVRSFRKLTGEGVTLVGSEIIKILEEVLPARFGGGPLDYQLVEEEDEQGFTRLSLLVNPKVEIRNETEVVQTILEELRRTSVASDLARSIWEQAEIFQLKRISPIWTRRGKFMPLRLIERALSSDQEDGRIKIQNK
jgi:hypothetical protein